MPVPHSQCFALGSRCRCWHHCWHSVCPCAELLPQPGALFQMWTSVSPTHVRTEPPASTVLAASAAGACRASEAPAVRVVSTGLPARWGCGSLLHLKSGDPRLGGHSCAWRGSSRPGLTVAAAGLERLVTASLNCSLLQAKETLLWPWALPAAGSLLRQGLGSALLPVPLPPPLP